MRNLSLVLVIAFFTSLCCCHGQSLVPQWDTDFYTHIQGDYSQSDILHAPDGGVYVCGETWGNPFVTAFMTLKYDSLGSLQWHAKFDYFLPDHYRDAVLTPNGVAVGGIVPIILDTATYINWGLVIGYNADGTESWSRYLYDQDTFASNVVGLETDQDGNIYAFGGFVPLPTNGNKHSVYVHKINPANGAPIWEAVVQDSLAGTQHAIGGRVFDDRIVVVGYKYKVTGLHYFLLELGLDGSLNASAEFKWDKIILERFCVDGGGNLVIADHHICKMTIAGDTSWCFDFAEGHANAKAQAMAVVPDGLGNIYGTGWVYDTLANEYVARTVKISQNGELLWSKVIDRANQTGAYESGAVISLSDRFAFVGSNIDLSPNPATGWYGDYGVTMFSATDGNVHYDTMIDRQTREQWKASSTYGNDYLYLGGNSYDNINDSGTYALYKFKIFDPTSAVPALVAADPTVEVAPSPFTDELWLQVEAAQAGSGQLVLYNAVGETVYQAGTTLVQGSNRLKMEGLGLLPNGLYTAGLLQGGRLVTKKVIKASP